MSYKQRALTPSLTKVRYFHFFPLFISFFVLLHMDSSTLTKLRLAYFFFLHYSNILLVTKSNYCTLFYYNNYHISEMYYYQKILLLNISYLILYTSASTLVWDCQNYSHRILLKLAIINWLRCWTSNHDSFLFFINLLSFKKHVFSYWILYIHLTNFQFSDRNHLIGNHWNIPRLIYNWLNLISSCSVRVVFLLLWPHYQLLEWDSYLLYSVCPCRLERQLLLFDCGDVQSVHRRLRHPPFTNHEPARLSAQYNAILVPALNAGWRYRLTIVCPGDLACNILWFYLSVQNQLFRSLSHLWSTYTLCNPMVSKTFASILLFLFLFYFNCYFVSCGLITGSGPCTYTCR